MRYKNFPDSLIMVLPHSMNPAIPVVERTYNADSPRGRCRHHKMSPATPTDRFNMSPHHTVRPVVISFSPQLQVQITQQDRKSTRLNSSHVAISESVFC